MAEDTKDEELETFFRWEKDQMYTEYVLERL